MKKTFLSRIISLAGVAGVLSGATVTCRADYASELLKMQPLTYWRFNENITAPVYYDVAKNLGSLGAAGDGLYYDAYNRPVPGAIASDSAVAFMNPSLGTTYSGSMRVTNNSALNPTGPFTVEFWAKPSNNTAVLLSPVNSMSFSTGRAGYLFYQNGAAWQFRVGVSNSTTASVVEGGVVTANQWQHVVGVYSGGASGTMTLYVNGVQVATGTGNYDVNANAPFYIGSTSSPGRTFDGAVDEVAFYSAALSASQIAAHYGAQNTNAAGYATQMQGDAPVGYWRLNEPAAFPTAANSGSLAAAEDAKYVAAINTPGPSGASFPGFEANNSAAAFDGTNTYLPAAGLALSGPLSVVAWVNPNSLNGDRAIAGENASWALKLLDSELRFTTPGIKDHTTTGASVQIGVWQQVAVTFTPGTVEGAKFYLNGQSVGAVDASALNRVTSVFWIGKNQWAGQVFDGAIDEVAVWDKALDPGRITSLYFTAIGSNAAPFMVSDPPVVRPPGTIYATTPFTITADVAGALPMFAQWRFNGVNLPGATNLTYSVSRASAADGGSYDVVVTNSYGAVTSSIVAVAINPAVPPTIDQQPASRAVFAGGNARFSVVPGGTTPFTYQWKKGGVNITGETNQTLVLTNITSAAAGVYSVGVTNVAGGIVSAGATLTVPTLAPGSFVEAVVTNNPVNYWRLDETSGTNAYDSFGRLDGTYLSGVTLGLPGGVPLAAPETAVEFDGTSNGQITLNGGQIPPPWSAMFWVKRPDGVVASSVLIDDSGYSLRLEQWDNTGRVGFTAYGVADYEFSYSTPTNQWVQLFFIGKSSGTELYVNGALADSNPNSISLPRRSIGNSGDNLVGQLDEVALYDHALSLDAIAQIYAAGVYGATTAPFISGQPASQTVVLGQSAMFAVKAAGSLPLSYQWKKGGTPIPGATRSAFSIASAAYGDAASYTVTATNQVSSVDSTAATLTVLPVPTFANLTNDLVVHLRFDTDFTDSSGRVPANDAYPSGSPALVPGKLGQAVRIKTDKATPTYQYLYFFVTPDLQFADVDSFSVSLWLRYTTEFTDLPIIGNARKSSYNPGWVLFEDNSKFAWTAVGGAEIIADPVGGPLINDGQWHQLTLVFDRTNLVANSYVDGLQVDSRSIAGLGSLDTGFQTVIGQDDTGAYGVNGTFDLDDLGIWRRVLSSYEVLSIYNAAQGAGQSFDVYGPVKLSIGAAGANTVIGWQAGTLESNTDLKNAAGWAPVPNAKAPLHTVTPGTGSVFYRVRQ